MTAFDVFNGDADGICALTQLRLAEPRTAEIVTGVKRDIALLERVAAAPGDAVTVLDISMASNRDALDRVLEAGADVFYVDHHHAGTVPGHDRLHAILNDAPDVCTSLLVNGHLGNRYRAWAAVGAFGDNLHDSARAILRPLGLADDEVARLADLGTYINYNGYGARIEDLHVPPDELFRMVSPHADPFDFIGEARDCFERLAEGYRGDMAAAESLTPASHSTDTAAVLMLPDASWARRVSGVYGNELCNRFPDRAHALLTAMPDGGYVVSVRAPKNRKRDADVLCREFPTGGGRPAAAGINALPEAEVGTFVDRFVNCYAA